MRRAVICVTAGLAAVAVGFGLSHATSRSTTEISVSKAATTPAISIWEIHNLAHLEFSSSPTIRGSKLGFRREASLEAAPSPVRREST